MYSEVASTLKLVAIASGMALAISCNAIMASLFQYSSGPQQIAMMAVASLVMLVIALSFLKLSSYYPGTIGIRSFTNAAFGKSISVMITLLYVGLIILVAAFEIYLCFEIFNLYMPTGTSLLVVWGLVGAIVVVNLRGLEISLRVQVFMTAAVVVMLVALFASAAGEPGEDKVAEFSGVLQALPVALFLFVGVEWVCLYLSRKEDYVYKAPIAIVCAVFSIFGIYALMSYSLSSNFEASQIVEFTLPHIRLAEVSGLPYAWVLATIISLLALLTSFNVGLSGVSRILYSLGREQVISPWFSALSIPKLIPKNAILCVALIVAGTAPVMFLESVRQQIPTLLGINVCIIYGAVLMAWLRLRPLKGEKVGAVRKAFVYMIVILLCVVTLGSIVEGFSLLLLSVLVSELALIFALVFMSKRQMRHAI